MKGIFSARVCDPDEDADDGASRGIEMGKLGLAVAVADGGGRESRSGVRPGTRSATTFWTWFAFCYALVNKEQSVSKRWYSHRYGASSAAVRLQRGGG
jgi:hypothetical protein